MANSTVDHVAIAGIAAAIPESVRTIDDEAEKFGAKEIRRIAKNLGVERRHVATGTMCASDLCHAAGERVLDALGWDRDTVDLLIFASVTSDHVAPATSCLLQDRLRLGKGCAAFDIPHACSGYVYGLWTASLLMTSGSIKRALVLAGDTVSRLTAPDDRSVAALFGDAGTATALQWVEDAPPMHFDLGTDGAGAENLIVRAGGFRAPRTAATSKRSGREGGNVRSDEDLYMNGTEIFAFTLREIPPLTRRVLDLAGWTYEDVDAFVMHQANRFIIDYLAKSLKIPAEKQVVDLVDVGNTSAASIPMALAGKLSARLRGGAERLVLLGFGSGLSWGGVALTCGPVVIPETAILNERDLAQVAP